MDGSRLSFQTHCVNDLLKDKYKGQSEGRHQKVSPQQSYSWNAVNILVPVCFEKSILETRLLPNVTFFFSPNSLFLTTDPSPLISFFVCHLLVPLFFQADGNTDTHSSSTEMGLVNLEYTNTSASFTVTVRLTTVG